MANINTNIKKSRHSKARVLPFERYLQSVTDPFERRLLLDECKHAIGATSDTTMYFYRTGRRRPDVLKRREIAKIICAHSGNNKWTEDSLFPKEFYK